MNEQIAHSGVQSQVLHSGATSLTTIKFHGADLVTTKKDGKILVAMKPIAEALGLDWSAQLKRIKGNEVLNDSMAVIATDTIDRGGREVIALPIELLNGWLFGIDSRRVKPEIKEKLIEYQRECYQALHDFHFKGVAVNSKKLKQLELTNSEQADRIKTLLGEINSATDSFERSYYKVLDGKKELQDQVQDLTKQIDRLQYENGALELKIFEQKEVPDWLLKDHIRQRALDLARISKVDIKTLYGIVYNYLKEQHNVDIYADREFFKSGLDAIEYHNHLRTVQKFLDRQGAIN